MHAIGRCQEARALSDQSLTRVRRHGQRRFRGCSARAYIDRLPIPHQEVLILRDNEELDTQQTAQHLCLKPGAVMARLRRAHQALRTPLESFVLGDEEKW